MLILMQPNLEAAVSFYSELGLEKRFHLQDKWAEFELAGISIGLCPINVEDLPDRRTGIVFEVSDLRALYEQEKAKDATRFIDEPVEAPHGIMISMRDPGGNIIDLYQPTPEKMREMMEKTAQDKEKGCSSGCCDHVHE
jgi:predicted enzyme related to lactoylglutathione lyase